MSTDNTKPDASGVSGVMLKLLRKGGLRRKRIRTTNSVLEQVDVGTQLEIDVKKREEEVLQASPLK